MRLARAAAETAVASSSVIGARLPVIARALSDPAAGRDPELARMVSEKTAAALAAQAAAWRAMTLTPLLPAAGIGYGWPALAALWMRGAEAWMRIVLAALLPVRRAARANARRLSRRA